MPERFLPVITEEGGWIELPGLMVLAAMKEPTDFVAIHEHMLLEEKRNPAARNNIRFPEKQLSPASRAIYKGIFKRDGMPGVHAGAFVMEVAALCVRGRKPSANAAIERAARETQRWQRSGAVDTKREAIRKAIRRFRDVLHLWGAWTALGPTATNVLGEQTPVFLGLAARIERMLDEELVGAWTWEPWRIPRSNLIAPITMRALDGRPPGTLETITVGRRKLARRRK